MRILLLALLSLFPAVPALAFDYGLGLSFDTSSNMLMRPGSPSGTVTNLFGGAGVERAGFSLMYHLDAGAVQHYDGIQFHRHTIELSRDLRPGSEQGDGQITLKVLGTAARYGEVSFLGGYGDFGGVLTGKRYIGESTLFRWDYTIRSRSYRDFGIEDFRDTEATVRLDRFLESGTTLRVQMDGGLRGYPNVPSSPVTSLFDLTFRTAQSLGARTGAWVEVHRRWARNEAVPDTSVAYDRLLFEDDYKSSALGGTFNIKHIFDNAGSVQFRTTVEKKRFGRNTASSYWYLPQNGWDELETEYALSFHFQPGFLPSMTHPSLDIYHRSVDSSLGDLSYRTTGVTVGVTLY